MPLVVSAPGKVLIAGGYLVLDPKYSGIVVSTSSRFYTVIQEQTEQQPFRVHVRSPQFTQAEWETQIVVQEDEGTIELQDVNHAQSLTKNKFLFLAVEKVLSLTAEIRGAVDLRRKLSRGLDITIVGDNDFYSQRTYLTSNGLPSLLSSLEKIPAFVCTNDILSNVHKTGLGSSAALITSVVAALFLHFELISPASLQAEGKSFVHNAAQYIHCLAQGKVGSGFDVSSAIYGSHVYRRFDPVVIESILNEQKPTLLPVLSPSNNRWNHSITPFHLPAGLRLMLADVDAGSDTPSLVGKVLKWRHEKPEEADSLWTHLSLKNEQLAASLTDLTAIRSNDPETYNLVLSQIATLTYPNVSAFFDKNKPDITVFQWTSVSDGGSNNTRNLLVEKISEVRSAAEAIRSLMTQMGQASGTPIEPPEQTRLLDECLRSVGVIAGGVPGAGGYDAIWLLVIEMKNASVVGKIEKVWQSWTELDVSPLSAVESQIQGLTIENLDSVRGLKDVLQAAI